MSFMIPTADDLVNYLKDFTGSNDTDEIKQCIFQAELMLRNIELPALRSNPYDVTSIGTVGSNSMLSIPADMNKPILFFQSGANNSGPWIVYDRVGDRDIITLGLLNQFYLTPVNTPEIIRGKFSEVGSSYQFVPMVQSGTQINMYYYKAWNLLFTPVTGGTPGQTVQSNAVLQSFPEGYVYGALHEYYIKKHNAEDASVYKQKFDLAMKTIEDQNSKGKWSGGSTRLTSVFQPRRSNVYSNK